MMVMRRLITVVAVALATACASAPRRPHVPQPPPQIEGRDAEFRETCASTYAERFGGQDIGQSPGAMADCLSWARAGKTAEGIRELWWVVPAPIPVTPPPVVVVPPPVTSRGRLRVSGPHMVDAQGNRVVFRDLMGFQLLDRLADGEVAMVDAFLNWARDDGFEVVRVLAANHGWMELAPADGLRHLPDLLARAESRGLYIHVVALAGSKVLFPTEAQAVTQVRNVASICGAVDNCVLEIANEPYHDTQADYLYSREVMRRLRAQAPSTLATTWGAPRMDEPLCGNEPNCDDGLYMGGGEGDFVVLHRKRRPPNERWDNVRRMRELYAVAQKLNRFTVDNEATGAGDQDTGSSRYADPDYFYAQGVLARLFNIGPGFHCSDCLFARVPPPGSIQRQAAQAFIAGTRIAPDHMTFTYQNTGHPAQGSPAASANWEQVTRVYFGMHPEFSFGIAVGLRPGVDNPGITWANGYGIRREISARPGVKVWEIGR